MKYINILLFLLIYTASLGQGQTYQNEEGETHLCGPVEIEDLEQEPYAEWFQSNYKSYKMDQSTSSWVEDLKNVDVKIFMGTWCSDSQQWVPAFVRLWDELGLDRGQLQVITVYDTEENRKQSPGGEEMGLGIHRVPTFIFERDAKELGRITEYPYTDLETDVKQIALGNPPESNYKTAAYVYDLVETKSIEEIESELDDHVSGLSAYSYDSDELINLGYVYLRSGMLDKAKMVFRINSLLFSNEANVYNSYAEALLKNGERDLAIESYRKVLELDPEHKHAKKQLAKLIVKK
ncbi:MAG: tetratricopeptide repeat protein [Bacteroidia bacterium]|nr:tetratricopeptide repeat protein [Bacteroidia bacterium]